MQLTAQMLRGAFQQTQREILDLDASDQVKHERFQKRWERMAELLNEKLNEQQASVTAGTLKGLPVIPIAWDAPVGEMGEPLDE